ncbi:SatD family protein [Winogradskyella psychrotolerans]|uniref:SatD family protein n=1 Tax=Winogradskyella psychrotolerans TaxID=1344585 RepID=UPI001C070511|nr:SatD family protein [Winogradskyella psychrotolerans]MBU2920766.1 SatD family protein [Winogradskyella psychrotolerans]
MINNKSIAVITGDIINSRTKTNPNIWIEPLKDALSYLQHNTSKWQIFRGDSFQIEFESYHNCLNATAYIKSCIKSIKGLDVRIAIGIGKKSYEGKNVSESNGEAFIYSGEIFEKLKKEKQNIKLKTKDEYLNKEVNLYFKLALIAMDNWTVNSAQIIKLSLENPNMIQSELASIIGISQDAVSKRKKRAYLNEILELNNILNHKLKNLKQ